MTGVKPCDDTLGMMGPVIRAVVGDTIKVVFRNNTPYPASVHPHGVFYTKAAEGAPYADGTRGRAKRDDAVAPGETYTYFWKVPDRAGPGPMDGSSVMWMYHSHTDEVADTNAGLVGPMVVTARGRADRATATPADVDREVFSYFTVENENASLHLDRNLHELAQAPHEVAADDEEGFEESNLMHSVNGYVYGNGPVPVDEGRSAGALVHLHARHRGRPAHAALARQHRDHQRDALGHDPAAARHDDGLRHGARTTRAPGCSTATSTTTSPPGCWRATGW